MDRLGGIRRVARRRLLFFGVFAVLAGGVAAFFTILTVDWLVWLPPVLRVVTSGVFIVGFAGATLHWIVAPLRAQLTIQELAGKIERHFPPLQDRLASSVNFLERGDTGSSPMAQHVVDATQQAIEHLPLESALMGGPVTRRAVACAATLALLFASLWWAPDWMSVGVKRYWRPWSDAEWPRRVAILPISSNQVVALGDSVTVSMRVQRGWHEALRAVVHFREPDGTTSSLALRHDGNGEFSTTIDTVTSNLEYWFEADDATTKDHPASVSVERRPEVIEATALVEAPPYARNSPSRLTDLRDGPVQAAMGGFVTVQLRASKNVACDESKTAVGLRADDGTWYPVQVDPDDRSKMSARWMVENDLQFRAVLHDELGFENRGSATYTLRAVPDAPPTIVVLEPPSVCEVTVSGSVRVVIRAEDDFGIEQVSLAVERPDDQTSDLPVEVTSRSVTSDAGTQVVGTVSWDIAALSASPGDVISYRAVARDNFRGADIEGQRSASPEMRIRILSDSEFQLRIREDLTALEERLRRTAFDQAALHDDTATLHAAAQTGDDLSDAQRGAAASMSLAQLRIARQVRETATRFDEIVRRIERNSPDSEERDRIALLGESLRNVAAGPMAGASALLGRAREPGEQNKTQSALKEATQAQQTALTGLRDVLRSMGQWGAFQGVVTRTRDLLDRQTQIRLQTAELGKSMLGKPVESMEPNELAALRDNQRKQEQLLDDVTEHLARLEQLRQSLAEKDPTAAEAIDAAMRSARAEDLVRHVRDAATAITANRAGAAEAEQRAATQALQKMLGALHERENRELALLRKKLDDAARQVDELIEEQNVLLAQTKSLRSPTESELETKSGEQRTLSRNARFLGDELIDVDSTADAGRIVRQSSTPMTKAENELLAGDLDSAVDSQQDSVKLLTDAREALLAAGQLAAEEMLRRTLADVHQDLQAILAAQQAINHTMVQLRDAMQAEGRLSRTQTREAARLIKEQLDARALVSGLLPDMEQAAVYRWALERVARWMGTNHDSLEAREFNDETIVAAERIVHELENLIAALVQTQSMPLDTEFIEADESGGATSGELTAPALPSLTELLVLKTMQDDINTRTAALYTRFDAQNPTEHSLRELTVLGEDQTQVQKLAQMVTDRSRRK